MELERPASTVIFDLCLSRASRYEVVSVGRLFLADIDWQVDHFNLPFSPQNGRKVRASAR